MQRPVNPTISSSSGEKSPSVSSAAIWSGANRLLQSHQGLRDDAKYLAYKKLALQGSLEAHQARQAEYEEMRRDAQEFKQQIHIVESRLVEARNSLRSAKHKHFHEMRTLRDKKSSLQRCYAEVIAHKEEEEQRQKAEREQTLMDIYHLESAYRDLNVTQSTTGSKKLAPAEDDHDESYKKPTRSDLPVWDEAVSDYWDNAFGKRFESAGANSSSIPSRSAIFATHSFVSIPDNVCSFASALPRQKAYAAFIGPSNSAVPGREMKFPFLRDLQLKCSASPADMLVESSAGLKEETYKKNCQEEKPTVSKVESLCQLSHGIFNIEQNRFERLKKTLNSLGQVMAYATKRNDSLEGNIEELRRRYNIVDHPSSCDVDHEVVCHNLAEYTHKQSGKNQGEALFLQRADDGQDDRKEQEERRRSSGMSSASATAVETSPGNLFSSTNSPFLELQEEVEEVQFDSPVTSRRQSQRDGQHKEVSSAETTKEEKGDISFDDLWGANFSETQHFGTEVVATENTGNDDDTFSSFFQDVSFPLKS